MALGKDIIFANDCVSNDAVNASQNLKAGNILLCENLRLGVGGGEGSPTRLRW